MEDVKLGLGIAFILTGILVFFFVFQQIIGVSQEQSSLLVAKNSEIIVELPITAKKTLSAYRSLPRYIVTVEYNGGTEDCVVSQNWYNSVNAGDFIRCALTNTKNDSVIITPIVT